MDPLCCFFFFSNYNPLSRKNFRIDDIEDRSLLRRGIPVKFPLFLNLPSPPRPPPLVPYSPFVCGILIIDFFFAFVFWLAAYTVFGIPQTINCANYVYFKCMQKVTDLGDPRATQAFTGIYVNLYKKINK